MPTWARVQSPISMSPSPRPSATSPSQASPAETRRRAAQLWRTGGPKRPSSAPAVRSQQRGRAAESQPSKTGGKQHWASQRSREAVAERGLAPASGGRQQRPWMAPALTPERGARDEAKSPYYGKAANASSFTPPNRSSLRPLQGQSGAKHAASRVSGRRSDVGSRLKTADSTSIQRPVAGRVQRAPGSSTPGAPHTALLEDPQGWRALSEFLDPDAWQGPAPGSCQQDVPTSATSHEMEQENSTLRALAEKLREQLAAAERREQWYQSTAHELMATGQSSASDAEESGCEGSARLSRSQALELESLHRLADRALHEDLNLHAIPDCRARREHVRM